MCKIFKACFLILLLILPITVHAHAAEQTEINQLIEQATGLDGKGVTVQGEAIGEVLKRGDYSWVNINDGTNAIGVWMITADAQKISSFGNYKNKGDTVRIDGIFHRACAEHGGEADIHSNTMTIVEKGYPTVAQIPFDKIIAAILLGFAAMVLVLFLHKKLKYVSV